MRIIWEQFNYSRKLQPFFIKIVKHTRHDATYKFIQEIETWKNHPPLKTFLELLFYNLVLLLLLTSSSSSLIIIILLSSSSSSLSSSPSSSSSSSPSFQLKSFLLFFPLPFQRAEQQPASGPGLHPRRELRRRNRKCLRRQCFVIVRERHRRHHQLQGWTTGWVVLMSMSEWWWCLVVIFTNI